MRRGGVVPFRGHAAFSPFHSIPSCWYGFGVQAGPQPETAAETHRHLHRIEHRTTEQGTQIR